MDKLSLNYKKLRRLVDEKQFGFKTTDELEPRPEILGQERALESVAFGIGIQSEGYNLFAMGTPGIGKRSIIRSILKKEAAEKPVPSDWCYLYNFESPQKPIALQLPAGMGMMFRQDMNLWVEDLKTSIPAIFESEEFRTRMQKIAEEINQKQETLFKMIVKDAKAHGLLIYSTHEGFSVLPLSAKGEVMTQEEFDHLSEDERKEKQSLITSFTHQLTNFIKQIPLLHKERSEKEKEVQREFTLAAVGHFIEELKKKYAKFPDVLKHLDAVERDVILNVKDFLKREEPAVGSSTSVLGEAPTLRRYQVNLLVDNSKMVGAPIVFEENPTYSNMICSLDHEAHFGVFVTDFTLIKPGALHKANGGYLMIEALKLLTQPYAWEGLKRALFARKITIEPLEQLAGVFRTTSLEPVPISLNVKVILLGNHMVFNLLHQWDPEFSELFKVAVDFDDNIEWNLENLDLYARLISTVVHKEKLLPFHRSAVAFIIEYSSRLSKDTKKLSIKMRGIKDLIHESHYWAKTLNKELVERSEVEKAIAYQIKRIDRVREDFYENIERNILMINTSGKLVGQINGLAVIETGNFAFGHPVRITANIRMGEGGVIDIQREVKLSGPIHSKGVLILSSFLAGRYSKDKPFSLSASLAFEQTYGMIEGDSASVAELCVLLSAISEVPINQYMGVTGSVNQRGEVQAVGGINEKIEGFFDICKARGLTGKEGVLIPASNANHLMLRADVVQAVKEKKFSVYSISTIDEAMLVLTGKEAGERNEEGKFPARCINAEVEKCLQKFAKKREKLKSKR